MPQAPMCKGFEACYVNRLTIKGTCPPGCENSAVTAATARNNVFFIIDLLYFCILEKEIRNKSIIHGFIPNPPNKLTR